MTDALVMQASKMINDPVLVMQSSTRLNSILFSVRYIPLGLTASLFQFWLLYSLLRLGTDMLLTSIKWLVLMQGRIRKNFLI